MMAEAAMGKDRDLRGGEAGALRVVTIATVTTYPQAVVLAASLQRQHGDWPVDIVLAATERPVDIPIPGTAKVRLIGDVLDVDVQRLFVSHDQSDFTTLLLPHVLRAYLSWPGAPVFHLPCTAWVVGDLEPVVSALARNPILLVPRTVADMPDDGLWPSQQEAEQVGGMSETAMGVSQGAKAEGFLAWWAERAERSMGSLDGLVGGARPEDRPWMARQLELAPARFYTGVLDDPGCNVSFWNLHERVLESASGKILVNGRWPLRFLSFEEFNPEHPYRLSGRATRVRVSGSPALRELCRRYADSVKRAGFQTIDTRSDIGHTLPNGILYDEALCRLHATATALGQRFGDLLGDRGSAAFTAWLESPAPRGAAHGITSYVFYRVLRERPDVVRAYPDLDGQDGADFVAWCWAFGRHEMDIPERFMPMKPSDPVNDVDVDVNGAATGAGVTAAGKAGSEAGRNEYDGPASGEQTALPAVRVTGYLGHTLGLGSAARAYVRALNAAGIQTSAASVPLLHLESGGMLDEEYGRHSFRDVSREGRHHFELVAVNPDELPNLMKALGEDYFEGRRIGIWGWETNSIPARWKEAFALVDEIWVYSSFMAANLQAATSCPVVALAPPVEAPHAVAETERLGVPEGFLFFFMFDYLSTIQRKNPVGLIEAFKRAFAEAEGPRLLIKTINAPLRPLAEEALLWTADGRSDIHVVDCSLSAQRRDALMAACDCYVSLHRSEGFGLTIAEAMAIGKPVIGTGYSGNLDFMSPHNSFLVEYELGRVGPECEIYPADGEWAEPSIEHAADLMRLVVADRERAIRIGAQARDDIARSLSLKATGAAMLSRLEELASMDGRIDGGRALWPPHDRRTR